MAVIGSNIMKSAWNGKNSRIFLSAILCASFFLPGCDDSPARPKADFYSYRGFRDWWRIPLRFPYQITMVDALEYGTLEKYDPASLIADPKCETVVTDIVAIGYDGKFVAFRRKNIDPPFGILIYTSGIVRYFAAKD